MRRQAWSPIPNITSRRELKHWELVINNEVIHYRLERLIQDQISPPVAPVAFLGEDATGTLPLGWYW
jgi:hypothetical protein